MIVKVVITQYLVIDEGEIPRKRDPKEWVLGVVNKLRVSIPVYVDGVQFGGGSKAIVTIVE